MIDDLPIDRAELLTDERGAYGLAILAHDDSPFSCGNRPLTAIYRPDRLSESGGFAWPILQPIPSIKFSRCAESHIAQALLGAMLRRDGFVDHDRSRDWGSDDPVEQVKNRRRYHGPKWQALWITNSLIRKALDSAPTDLIKLARCFPLAQRYTIYKEISALAAHGAVGRELPSIAGSDRPQSPRSRPLAHARAGAVAHRISRNESSRAQGGAALMKTTTITRALLSDRETERPAQPQSRPCFACGRSFLYRRAVGDNSGRFCSCSMTSTKRPRAKPGPGNCQVCRSEHLHAINLAITFRHFGMDQARRINRALDKRLRNLKADCHRCHGTGLPARPNAAREPK